jgi:membrane protein DedA with SNARE-associated domain
MLSNVSGWISKLTQAGVGLVGLAIVAQVIFGSSVAFLPGDVVASLMGIISSLGSAGLVGLVTAGLLYQILK